MWRERRGAVPHEPLTQWRQMLGAANMLGGKW